MSAPAVSSPDKSRPNGLHPDEQTLAQYSTVSRSAVLAAFLGLASPLVLVSPLLVVVPLAAAAVGAVALRRIATSGGQFSGRWPATIGLCLAALFLGWGLSRQWTRQAVLAREAEQFAEGWLQLVRQGKHQRAHQLTVPPDARLNSDASIAEFYQNNKEAGENLRDLFGREPLKSFLAMGPAGTLRLKSVAGHSQRGFSDEVVLQYALGKSASDAPLQSLWITVERMSGENRIPAWRISRADGEPPPDFAH